jgi:hypothetical protein
MFAKGRIFAVEKCGGAAMETSPCVHQPAGFKIFVIKLFFISKILI